MCEYVTNNEIAVKNYADAMSLMEILLDNGYVVMISREEKLYIINFIWSANYGEANRNDVCFQPREAVEDWIFNPTDEKEENQAGGGFPPPFSAPRLRPGKREISIIPHPATFVNRKFYTKISQSDPKICI